LPIHGGAADEVKRATDSPHVRHLGELYGEMPLRRRGRRWVCGANVPPGRHARRRYRITFGGPRPLPGRWGRDRLPPGRRTCRGHAPAPGPGVDAAIDRVSADSATALLPLLRHNGEMVCVVGRPQDKHIPRRPRPFRCMTLHRASPTRKETPTAWRNRARRGNPLPYRYRCLVL